MPTQRGNVSKFHALVKKKKKNVFPEFLNDEKLVSKILPSIFPARRWIIL